MEKQIELYREILEKTIIQLCKSNNLLTDRFFDVEELNECWRVSAPEYMADAVPEIKDYPTVAIAWALYYGMGAAYLWDSAWEESNEIKDLYVHFREKRGFDYLDEYIIEDLIRLEGREAEKLNSIIENCSRTALTLIRKEGFEAQSKEAFYIFVATTDIFFRLGVSLELFRLGYKYEKVSFSL